MKKILMLALLVAPSAWTAEGPSKLEELLKKTADQNDDVRFESRALAAAVGAPAVVPLADLMVDARLDVARTARAALEKLVHHAGRPGAEAERGPVVAELAKLLKPGRPPAVQREALYLIAAIGGDEAVPPVAALLDAADPTVREQARLSLERIPGKAAVEALVAAVRNLPDARRPDFLYSLAKKNDRSSVKHLLELAGSSDAEVRLTALEAVARLGAPEGVAVMRDALAKANELERGRLYTEYLRLADNLQKTDPSAAQAIYRQAIVEAPLDHLREQALGAACPPGSAESLPLLLAGLADPVARVRRVAGQRIGSLPAGEVVPALVKAYQSGQGPTRALLLRAIADRDAVAAKPLLEEASGSGSLELKITALDALDKLEDPQLEPVYQRMAESGPDWLRPTALKGYLALARLKAQGATKADALPMFEKVMDLAREPEPRLEALRGLLAVGDTRSISRVQSLLADPQLGPEAARGYVALAAALGKAGDRAGAQKHLMDIIAGEYSRDLKGKAAEELKGLGFDPQEKAHAQGFVVHWWVVTPMPDSDGKRLEKKDFPEDVVNVEVEHREGERKFRWQEVSDLGADGRIDLIPLFRRSERVITYAYTELESDTEREVLFKMGSDDGIACWLNGQRLLMNNVSRGFKVDEDWVKAHLLKGKNKVLVKISQKDGDWAFIFRVTDPDGKPLDPKKLAASKS